MKNLTPKEKAKELINLHYKIIRSTQDGDTYFDSYNPTNRHLFNQRVHFEISEKAKQCALICVDEILKLDFIDSVFISNSMMTLEEFYQEVKKEIK